MRKFVFAAVLVFLTVAALNAQSGRRVTTAIPTPMRTPAADDSKPQYSESKPRKPRTERIPNRFPNISIRKDEPAEAATPVQTNVPDQSEAEGETLRIETNLITIPVSVFDRNGLYIPGLTQKNFKIFEDGVEQEIAYFGTTEKPFTVALVIDVSPSTAYKIEEIQRAARAFVDQLQPHDNVIVIEFDQSVNVLAKVTNDREKIYKAIRRADFGNGTSLYDAVDEALRKQLAKIPGRKAVVLFTDGVDTTSHKRSYDSTLKYAEESDSLVFPIYYNTYFENRQPVNTFPNIFITTQTTSAEDYALGRSYLSELADATGGRVFQPESTPGGLVTAFEGIAEELRRQYSIGYVPKDEGTSGQRKQIKVRVNRPNLVLRARDSYIVGATAQGAEAVPQTK
jgi:Ca-activated chloride channel family protein